MYFVRQISSWQANNSLKKYLSPVLTELSGQQVEDPTEVIRFLSAKIAFANHHFRKCTSIKLTSRSPAPSSDATVYITVGEVGELALYPIRGTFKHTPQTQPSTETVSPGSPPADAKPYSLFTE